MLIAAFAVGGRGQYKRFGGSRRVVMSGSQCKVIDAAVHVWSNGKIPFSWEVEPPDELQTAATHEALVSSAQAAGVAGALIVQPANHKFDHSYTIAAMV